MASDDEVTAALLILTDYYDRLKMDETDLRAVCRAMLLAAETIRLNRLERELAKMSNSDEANGSI